MNVLVIVLEAIIYCLLTALIFAGIFKITGPLGQIHNYPPAIYARAKELGLVDEKKVRKTELICKSIGLVVLLAIPLFIIIKINGVRTFLPAFLQFYIFWTAWSWFDALIFDCLWFCHSKKWIIPGTEDMVSDYHDYWFHIKYAVYGLGIYLIPAAVFGGLIALIAR